MLREAAIAALLVATPCFGQDLRPAEPAVLYYVSVPLGGPKSERGPVVGIAFQSRQQRVYRVDSRILSLVGAGGLEVKWLIVGGVAAGAAVLAAARDSTVEAQRAQQEQARQSACPARPAC